MKRQGHWTRVGLVLTLSLLLSMAAVVSGPAAADLPARGALAPAAPEAATVRVRVAAGNDDAEEVGPDGTFLGGPGNIYTLSTDLELVEDFEPTSSGTQTVGIRFRNVQVPRNASVLSAYIVFRAVAPDSPNTNNNVATLTVYGQAADNPPGFVATSNNPSYDISTRPRTTASAGWTPSAWSSGTLYNTADLSAIVEEIAARPGWSPGNSMVFIITGSGSRSAYSYDGSATNAPELVIQYQTGLAVVPDNTTQADAGDTVTFSQAVAVYDLTDEIVDLTAMSNHGWTTRIYEDENSNGVKDAEDDAISATPPLGPFEKYSFLVQVDVPLGTADGIVDVTTVTGDGRNSGQADTAIDTTQVGEPPVAPPVLDGRLDEAYGAHPDADIQDYCDASGETLARLYSLYDANHPEYVWVALEMDRTLVDNTYGSTVHQSWIDAGKTHTLSNMDGSDKARLVLKDTLGNTVFDFTADYVENTMTTVSGWGSAGVTGGEGSITIGSASNLLIESSLGYDLNHFCTSSSSCVKSSVDLFANSPPEDGNYVPLDSYFADWQYSYLYEIRVNAAAFANGFGAASIFSTHVSPNKVGDNEIPVTPCTGSIGDRVWQDHDGDGVQETGEAGLNGVMVRLYRDNGDGVLDTGVDEPTGIRFTSGDGDYDFTGLGPDTYFVDVVDGTVPAEYVSTTLNDPLLVTLGASEDYNDADFGYRTLPELEMSKVLTSSDPAYVGQEIRYTIRITNTGNSVIDVLPLQDIYDPTHVQFLGATPAASSDAGGVVTWNDLTTTEGDLGLGESVEVEMRFLAVQQTTGGLAGALAALAPAADPVVDGRLDANYTYVQHFDYPTYQAPGNLYRYVGDTTCYWALVVDRGFNDNVYADPDAAYLLLDGWNRTHKYADLDGSDKATFNVGSLTGLAIDYIDGNYQSVASSPINAAATSLVWNMTQSGWDGGTWGGPEEHSPPYDWSGDWEWHMIYEFSIPKSALGGVCPAVTLADAHNSPSKYVSTLGRIGDLVWDDVNRDQSPAGEDGLPDITVNLYQGTTLVRTTQTEPGTSGYYIFSNLAGGSYTVNVDESTLPPGYTLTTANEPKPVTIAAGGSFLTADFGYSASNGSIGDRVFYDVNGDGWPDDDGEIGLNGVTVNLYQGSCAAPGSLLRTQVTAGNGDYDFTMLPVGQYCVNVDESTLPANVVLTAGTEPLTVDLDQDEDFNEADFGYRSECVGGTADLGMVSAAEDIYGSNPPPVADDECVVIERPPADIGDYVWYDADSDGLQDLTTDEPGIGNVPLKLYRDDGDGIPELGTDDPLVDELVTDADGGYLFKDVVPGDYWVDVEETAAPLAGLTHTLGLQSQPDPVLVTVDIGQPFYDADFGYVRDVPGKAVIGDYVWYDADQEGDQDWGEMGIAGVQVCAAPVGGGAAICDTTDATGIYRIEVDPGTYEVYPVPPPPPLDFTLTTPPSFTVTVEAGEQYLSADFGYYHWFYLGTIGNLVFEDVNENGFFDAGDSPIAGVSVDLIRDSDNDGVLDAGEPIVATVATGSTLDGNNGNYEFSGVLAGRYFVRVSDTSNVLDDYAVTTIVPGTQGVDGYNQAQPHAVNLGPQDTYRAADFGYVQRRPLGVIGNQVWYEEDVNGLYNEGDGEKGIAGVTVDLYRNGATYGRRMTGPSGRYAFTGLPEGDYRVEVSDNDGVLTLAGYIPTVLGPVPGDDNNNQAQPYAITLGVGEANTTADFGYTLPGDIGDYVWYDADKDGIQDHTVEEPGIGNVPLKLYRDDGDGIAELGTQDELVEQLVTDEDGGYLFADVPPGDYWVDVEETAAALAGLDLTTGPQSQPDPVLVTVLPGEPFLDADFGYVQDTPGKAVIGDYVWWDADGLGDQDQSELGIKNIQVCAFDGVQFFCDTTDDTGTYRIEVNPGTYTVAPTNPPAGYTVTTPPSYAVTVAAGDQYLTADFGYYKPDVLGTIGDQVWEDTTVDGVYDDGTEDGIPGVSVDLIRNDTANDQWDAGEPIVGTVTTDQDGWYEFTGVPAGDYLVLVSDTSNVLDDYAVTVPGTAGVNNHNQAQPYRVILANPGDSNDTADFGYVKERPLGVIGNQVWYEEDYNGLFDPEAAEEGIAGVTVDLYRNGATYGRRMTGPSGRYAFTGLPAGDYEVLVSDVDGVVAGWSVTAYPADQSSDNTNKMQPYAITLGVGEENKTADFGYGLEPGDIGDYVWYDADKDGIQDYTMEEPGIGNVPLKLYRDDGDGIAELGTDDPLVEELVTDEDGGYLFADVPPGDYWVDVEETAAALAGLDLTTGPQSQPDPVLVTVLEGEAFLDADFGYVQDTPGKAVIGDYVWWDGDGQGDQDQSELGIKNIQVCAFNGGQIFCDTTDDTGYYRIEVNPGTYTVAPTNPPAGYTVTTPPSYAVTVAAGDQYLTADFGYYRPDVLGTIGDQVWEDTTVDGVYDDGTEDGIPGVSVDLIRNDTANDQWDAGEPIVDTVTTDQDGWYEFTGVPAGDYLVLVSDTSNVLDDYGRTVPGTAGVNNHNQAQPYRVILANPGDSNDTADFGYVQQQPLGVIGNQVWYEGDGDGYFEPGDATAAEKGVAGVTVDLYRNGSYYGRRMTGPSGRYAFTGLPAGDYEVVVSDVDGVVAGWLPTFYPADQSSDNTNKVQPYAVSLALAGDENKTADFGYTPVSDYEISKTLNTMGTIYKSDAVSFTIAITNVGDTWIGVLPMRDVYSTTYLTYGYTDTFGVATFADPDSDDHHDDGVIDWSDLTVSFGQDLAPGASFTVVVTFTAQEDTTLLPNGETINTAQVHDALADLDGPGPQDPDIPLPEKEDSDGVRIDTPTAVEGVVLASLKGRATPGGVWIAWETATEANILGFKVHRKIGDGAPVQVHEGFIFAAGAGQGAAYEVLDDGVVSGSTYVYLLEVQQLDGTTGWHRLEPVDVPWWHWLPVVVR